MNASQHPAALLLFIIVRSEALVSHLARVAFNHIITCASVSSPNVTSIIMGHMSCHNQTRWLMGSTQHTFLGLAKETPRYGSVIVSVFVGFFLGFGKFGCMIFIKLTWQKAKFSIAAHRKCLVRRGLFRKSLGRCLEEAPETPKPVRSREKPFASFFCHDYRDADWFRNAKTD